MSVATAPFDWADLPLVPTPAPALPPLAHPVPVTLRGALWHLDRGPVPTGDAALTLVLEFDGTPLVIEWSEDPLPVLAGGDGGVPDVGALTAAERALLIRHLAHAPLAALSDRLGRPVNLARDGGVLPDQADIALSFRLDRPGSGDAGPTFAVRGPAPALTRLTDLLPIDRTRLDGRLGAIPVALGLHGRPFPAPADDLAQMAPGDALITPAGWSELDGLRVSILQSGAQLPVLNLQGVLRTRKGRFTPPLPPDRTEPLPMTQMPPTLTGAETDFDAEGPNAPEPVPAQASGAPLAQRCAAFDVTVSIELDRTTVTLAELSALEDGAVLPFEAKPGGPVRLLANGAAFAEGELVRVEDRIGLRIAKIL